jgi:hypothetical protein
MSYHFKGRCISCGKEVEFLSARPYERECADCQFFKPAVGSQKKPLSTGSEFWDQFPAEPRGSVFVVVVNGKRVRKVDASFAPFAAAWYQKLWRQWIFSRDSAGDARQHARVLSCSPEGLGGWRAM